MALKASTAPFRSPASCAACARRSLVIGSLATRRSASAACLAAARASPAPTAIMPRERAANPFSRLCARVVTETTEGMRKTKRNTPQTMEIAIASAATTPSASISETSYSTPLHVSVTTPGLSASHVSPRAANANPARNINRRNMASPHSQGPARRLRAAYATRLERMSRLRAARQPPDRGLAD